MLNEWLVGYRNIVDKTTLRELVVWHTSYIQNKSKR